MTQYHVYRCPGSLRRPDGLSYDVAGCDDERWPMLQAKGWHKTAHDAAVAGGVKSWPAVMRPIPARSGRKAKRVMPVAAKGQAAFLAAVAAPAVAAVDNSPPSRAEIETKCTELGIEFDGRHSDSRLLAKITAALEAR